MASHLKKILKEYLSAEELELVEGSYDVVGDIAVVRLADSLIPRASLIAKLILATNTKLKVVARRSGKHTGEFRTTDLVVIGGENRTGTEVREFGLRYRLDLANCYFSVRTGAERRRIASLVQPGERVLVLFSGIAPFPLMIAKYSSAKEIVGVEKNSVAHRFALENRSLNRQHQRVRLYCADAALVVPELAQQPGFHRLLMPLPVGGQEFLPVALAALLPGGSLHFYTMSTPEEVASAIMRLQEIAVNCGRRMQQVSWVKTGHCGNRLFRYSLEGRVE